MSLPHRSLKLRKIDPPVTRHSWKEEPPKHRLILGFDFVVIEMILWVVPSLVNNLKKQETKNRGTLNPKLSYLVGIPSIKFVDPIYEKIDTWKLRLPSCGPNNHNHKLFIEHLAESRDCRHSLTIIPHLNSLTI